MTHQGNLLYKSFQNFLLEGCTLSAIRQTQVESYLYSSTV